MYRGQRIAVVMPAYNAGPHLTRAVRSVPSFVDDIIVVDDASSDGSPRRLARRRPRCLTLLRHRVNRGVGAAIATGYAEALRRRANVIAVMAGDGQMDPDDLPGLLDPVIEGRADYAKGNRFSHPDIWRAMPACRLFGNIVLSLLTKLSSGYGRLFDSQCGYTVVSRAAAHDVLGGKFYARYGYPNDVLARLRAAGARVVDVPVRPVYQGQSSGIRVWTVLYPMIFVIACSWVWRLYAQYLAPAVWRRPARRLAVDDDTTRAVAARLR